MSVSQTSASAASAITHCVLLKQRAYSGVKHLEEIRAAGLAAPAVNQIELHPFCQQRPIVEYCREHGIFVQAFCPLVRGKFDDPVLQEVARKYNKEVSQVLVRWSLQHGCAAFSLVVCARWKCVDGRMVGVDSARCRSRRSRSGSCLMRTCTTLRYRRRIWRRSTRWIRVQRVRRAGTLLIPIETI